MLKEIKAIYKVMMSTIIVIVTLVFVSCDSNIPQQPSNKHIQKTQYKEDTNINLEKDSNINLEGILLDCSTLELIYKQIIAINEKLEADEIDKETAEAEFKNALKPLIENGHKLKELLLPYYDDIDNDDVVLSATVFIISAFNLPNCKPFYEGSGPSYAPSAEQIFHCLAAVVGYYTAKDLMVKATVGLATATTVWAVVRALAKKYAGYAGLALMIYEFYQCLALCDNGK